MTPSDVDYIFTLTADKTSVKAGETVNLTVTIDGVMLNAKGIQYSIAYDSEEFSTSVSGRNPACFDSAWYAEMKDEKGLGYIAKPSVGINNGALNVMFASTDGNIIDKDSPDLSDATTAIAGKVIFTALKDVADISKSFELKNQVFAVYVSEAQPTLEKPSKCVQLKSGSGGEDDTDQKAADAVIAKINAIGTVTLDSKAAIEEAEAAYSALTDAQKALVSNYETLKAARTAYDKLVKDKAAADAVIALINDIGTVEATDESNSKIVNAETAYSLLTADQKALVSNYETLKAARAEYERLVADKADLEAAQAVIDKINEIGTVEATNACLERINAAEAAYNALATQKQKDLVTNYSKIAEAKAEYERLVEEAANKAKAAEFDAMVDAITVENTAECEAAINAAYAKYETLTDAVKAFVTKKDALDEKKAAYDKLVKDAADKAAADNVIDLIGKIGTVTLESKGAIDAARDAHNKLTEDQKALIPAETLKVLTDAEAEYERLVNESKQEEIDKAAAKAVDDLIDAIGEVTLDSKAAIDAADAAYGKLTEAQQKLVTKKDILDAAKTAYEKLVKDAADKAEAAKVDALIDAIGEVTLDSKDAIEAAEAALNALTEDQKAYVTKEETLKAARADYDKLVKAEADKAEAAKVDALIDAIGEVTLDSKAAIEAAEAAFNALTEDQKAYVAKKDVLDKARADYDKLVEDAEKPVVKVSEKPIYGDINMGVISNVKDGKTVKVDGNEAIKLRLPNSKKGDELSYREVFVIAVKGDIDTSKIEVTDGTPTVITLGRIELDGEAPTATDALIVNKKVAGLAEADAYFANPLAFAVADINGSGNLTALDAYLINMLSAGSTEIDWADKNIVNLVIE